MTRSVVVAMFVTACGSSQPPPPSNKVAEPVLRCKTVVEGAATAVKLHERDVTMAIGECEQKAWSSEARECIAAVHASDDLVACSAKYDLGKRGIFADRLSWDQAMTAMERFRDQMCACKDTACAQRASDDMTKWSGEMAKRNDEPPTMTEEDTKRMTVLGEAMGKCMQQAMGVP